LPESEVQRGGRRRGRGVVGGEMAQTMYASMNKQEKKYSFCGHEREI
jgi:hypothetical protein